MAEQVTLGFTIGEGKAVFLDLERSGQSKNTFIVGATGSGKSVLGRTVITQGAQLGFKVIILELKDEPDYAPWYPNINPYISQSSDPDVLGELLHLGTDKIDLLIHLGIEEGDSWDDILELLQKAQDSQSKVSKERHLSSRDRRNAQSIRHYLKQLMNTINKMSMREDLENVPQVSVMNLRHIPLEIQQLVARSVAEWILSNASNTILFIDEFKRIAPQAEKSPAHNMMIRYAGEGRSKGDFLVVMNQTIVGVNDEVRASLLNWILGKAIDVSKVERVQKQISMIGLPLQLENIAQLKTGEFYVCDFNDVTVEKMFAWADWISREDAIAVARGEKKLKDLSAPPAAPAVIPGVNLMFERTMQERKHADAVATESEDWSDIIARIEKLESELA